jgi:23S rRNA (cytidine1920-2'-O)/16S rRNA (cytidine1409-2'-O)-methyltransferase
VAEGLADNRSRAQALIRAGRVLVDDEPRDKPGQRVPDGARIRLRGGERRFVSRGGEKLAGVLSDLAIDVRGRTCLDVGASTGGFCDCLLQAGAVSVVAVDVGYGQLDARLRADPRVRVLERTNARHLTREDIPETIDLVTVDVSFISVRLLLPSLARAAPGAELLVLVKPQFEVGRDEVGRGGVVRSDRLREAAAAGVRAVAEGEGYRLRGQADSRLPGPKGNREIFLWLAAARADEGGDLPAH